MELANKSVIVTGGAGFIGSHLVDQLLGEGVKRVVIYDDLSTGSTLNIKHLIDDKRVIVVQGNILDVRALKMAVIGMDVVFHMAAHLEIFKSINAPQEEAITNIIGTLNVLEAARCLSVEKLVFTSSAGCYGQSSYSSQSESHPLRPQWPYGVSKLAAEKYCSQFYALHGLNTVSLRYGIVYGEREWYRRVMTVFLKNALEGKPLTVFGDGQQTRDFIHVDDVTRATTLAAKSDNAYGKAINIGSGIATSVQQLAELVIQLTGGVPQLQYTNPDSYEDGRKPGELVHMCLAIKTAKELLDWEPVITLEEGLTRYINWLGTNKNAYWGGNQ